MNVKKFVAPTARDALHKVKEILGPDAIILSNRGLPGGGVEIMAVASRDMAALAPSPAPLREVAPRVEAQRPSSPVPDDDYTVSLSANRAGSTPKPFVPPVVNREAAKPAPTLASRPMPRIETPAPRIEALTDAEIVPANVMAEIRALRQIVELVLRETGRASCRERVWIPV